MNESSAPPTAVPAAETTVALATVMQRMDALLVGGHPETLAPLARLVLQRLPRHLPTYQRLLHATWALKRWQEGEDWARRLLQADPSNALAWRSLAWAVEQKSMLAAARAMWQRAFEAHPYEPEIRSGLSRTSVDAPAALTLDAACLAAILLRGGRWSQAAAAYRALIQAEPRRIDFLVNGMAALWQQGAQAEAYRLARQLTRQHPHLLMGWVVLNALGNPDDQALARNPLRSMDPDGEMVRRWLQVPYDSGREATLTLTVEEATLVAG